jgi:type II secretory ATPase GspE/PulE/Tfp pilus assembly ATPase PilB-like protein
MAMNEELRTLILERASESRLAEAAARAGMMALRDECLARVMEGETTLEEVVRLTQDRWLGPTLWSAPTRPAVRRSA